MAAPDVVRKKSPRAPSIPLDEALDKALKVYDKERLHPAPADVVAQHMGYKDANNGRALGALASLRYYGLVERHSNGLLNVTKDVEGYRYAPSDEMRRAYLRRFLTAPVLFAELLERYSSGLPSDGNLRYELIQRDFLPATAESLVGILRRSADFAKVYEQESPQDAPAVAAEVEEFEPVSEPAQPVEIARAAPVASVVQQRSSSVQRNETLSAEEMSGHDRIPVRLAGGRRAWLLIPHVFHEADKLRLKAQIDLLLTEDEEL
jgi:hypothetical protein